ncbi:MAG: TetR family transcriptional regulator [Emcibacter sp.]|nr:TetR family transcriptional regulator [Emcibacter sp.]
MTKRFKRRDLILEKANLLFTERGFSDTSLANIADAVGIKRESLYYYYPGKYDLLYDIIEPQIINVMKNFDQITAQEEDIRKIIERGIYNHLEQFNSSYLHMALAIRKNSRKDVQQKFTRLYDMFKCYEDSWIKLIHEACGRGDIKSKTPPKMLVYSILGLCNSLSSWYRPDGDLSLDHVARYFTDIVLNGIDGA